MKSVNVPTWDELKGKYATLTPVQAMLLLLLGTPFLLLFLNLLFAAILISAAVVFGAVLLRVLAGIGSALTRKKG